MKESKIMKINEEMKKNLKFYLPPQNISFCNLFLSQCYTNPKISISQEFLEKKFTLFKLTKKQNTNNENIDSDLKQNSIKKRNSLKNNNDENKMINAPINIEPKKENEKAKKIETHKIEEKKIAEKKIIEKKIVEKKIVEIKKEKTIKEEKKTEVHKIKEEKKMELTDINEKYIYKKRLLDGCNNFIKIKEDLKKIAFDPKYKELSNKILISITPTINQLNTFEVYQEKLELLISNLNELKELKNKELYICGCNDLLSLIFKKSLSLLKQSKTKIYLLSKVIYNLKSSTIINLFFQRIVYICPYIIPIQFTSKDFSDQKEVRLRQGFIEEEEQLTDFNDRMECYEYLYFTFLFNNYEKYKPIIVEYLDIMEESEVNFAISNSYKVFLNVFGNIIKGEFINKIKTLSNKIRKGLEEEIKKTKISNIKSIGGSNNYKIKDYMKTLEKGKNTDFHEDLNKII